MEYVIDHVRKTVLSVLNKENRGILTVSQFNSYAKHAQQLLFDQYFAEYTRLSTLKNTRRLSRDQGDLLSMMRSSIDKFMVTADINNTAGYYIKPEDLYSPISIVYQGSMVEYVPKHKEPFLEMSNMAGPSELYPGYCDENDYWYLKPNTLTEPITLSYIRTLANPNWTYNTINEDPVFNPDASDFQDFELNPEDTTKLVIEILKLSGVTIREAEITQAATQIDAVETQKENV